LTEQSPLALRLAALRAVGQIGVKDAALQRQLLAALGDIEPAVRFEAARALRRAGSEKLARRLLKDLQSGAATDPFAHILALPGPLYRSTDATLIPEVGALIAGATGRERDGLIEALGWMPGPNAILQLQKAFATDVATRAKLAEALAGPVGVAQTESEAVLLERAQSLLPLLADRDVRVRSNAAWTAGLIGERSQGAQQLVLPKLKPLLSDVDESVAANATVSFARAARGLGPERIAEALCPLVNDARPYVRANALTGLAVHGAACARASALEHLSRDRSPIVRSSAARALWTLQRDKPDVDAKRALQRCAESDISQAVASECVPPASAVADRAHDAAAWATIFIVPAGAAEPVALAPFALALPSGWVRLGFADRRGAVFEASESGPLTLQIAAGGRE
jgi:HEAT repeat protein